MIVKCKVCGMESNSETRNKCQACGCHYVDGKPRPWTVIYIMLMFFYIAIISLCVYVGPSLGTVLVIIGILYAGYYTTKKYAAGVKLCRLADTDYPAFVAKIRSMCAESLKTMTKNDLMYYEYESSISFLEARGYTAHNNRSVPNEEGVYHGKHCSAQETEDRYRSIPACPICGSKRNVRRINEIDRTISTAVWGIVSSSIGKQFECTDCRYKFNP